LFENDAYIEYYAYHRVLTRDGGEDIVNNGRIETNGKWKDSE
jgi:hypothetical protein